MRLILTIYMYWPRVNITVVLLDNTYALDTCMARCHYMKQTANWLTHVLLLNVRWTHMYGPLSLQGII